MPLSHLGINNARPQEKPYKLSDGNGLHLLVRPNGHKFWRFRYRFYGIEKMLALGSFPATSLADARGKRDEARKLLEAGRDPAAQKMLDRIAAAAAAQNTFSLIADEFLANMIANGASAATIAKNTWLLKDIAAPIANRPIAEITPAEILDLLKRVEKSGRRETARRLRGTIGAVFRLAIVTLRTTSDPTYALKGALLRPNTKSRAAITDERAFGALLRAIDAFDGWPTIGAALKFCALTCARPGEVRGATRSEINFEKAIWRIPEERTKMRRRHDVPLSRQAIAVLRDIWPMSDYGKLIFPSIRSNRKPLSDVTIPSWCEAHADVYICGALDAGEEPMMDDVRESLSRSYDPAQAVLYGQLVEIAYHMYDSAQGNPAPPPPSPFFPGFKFIAWVQMKDFIIEDSDWTFYGLIAQNMTDTNKFILAIRGTSNLTEWWDDLTSMVLVPLEGFGKVGYGFNRIYQTLRVVTYAPTEALGAKAATRSLESTGTFAQQVAAAVQQHAAAGARRGEATTETPPHAIESVEVTGHSLGSALATLYVAENANAGLVKTPMICTFASPRVGDPDFATKFDQLGITSWRIVNELDIVPKLPFLGFQHVETEHAYNSGSSVVWSLACWHSLNTYLNLLDPKQPLSPDCRWPPKAVATAALRPHARPTPTAAALGTQAEKGIAVSVPIDHGATINVTIKIEQAN